MGWQNINFPIWLGSWKSVDPLNVTRLHHGWLYTSGVLSGFCTETKTDRVRRNDYFRHQ